MPLYSNAVKLIRANLEAIANGKQVRAVAIGFLTQKQLDGINSERASRKLPPIVAKVLFVGGHAYKSRVKKDGYTIDDMIDQIVSAMSEESVLDTENYMSAIINPTQREDRYGNKVRDKVVLECSMKHPKAELYSVVATGDKVKPKDFAKKQKGHG